jgi:hypothetical protein
VTRAEGGSPWAGRRRARCSGAPPPSRASRGTWATPDPRARGRYRRSSPGRRGCRRPAPRGKRGAAHRLRGRERGRVSRGRGRDGAGSAKSAMWVGIVIFLVQKASRARRKCISRPERSDAVGGFRGSDAPAAPLAIATVTRGDVRACGVGLASGEEARAPRRDFPTVRARGGTTLDFFERANSRRHPQSWLSARRDSCLFGEFLSLRRLRLSFAPSVKEPGAMASTENMPPLPEAIAALKDEGNGFFRAGDFLKAAGAYTKALKVRPVARPVSRFRITRLANRRSADARGASL